jgi:hypothetical protein
MLDNGEEVRCLDQRGIMFTIFDRTASMSAINVDMAQVSLDQQMAALWSDDPTYAQYLISTFEMLWQQSVPVEERIQQLLSKARRRLKGADRDKTELGSYRRVVYT